MSFFYQFGLLFTNMTWFVAVCLIVGIILLFIEIFMPGFGIFGVSGIVLLAVGTILRAVFHQPEDIVWMQELQLVLLLAIFIIIAFTLFVIGTKRKWFKGSIFNQDATAVNLHHSDGTEDFRPLIGKIGITLTALRPSGKISIGKDIYDVTAESFFVEQDKTVEIIGVEGTRIVVRNKN